MRKRNVAAILAILTVSSVKSQTEHKTILDSVINETILQASENTVQEPEIPLVFAQWWFWLGLILILVFIKYVVFKK